MGAPTQSDDIAQVNGAPSRETPSLLILFSMMFASQLALTIYLPAVVDIARDLGTTVERVQYIIPA